MKQAWRLSLAIGFVSATTHAEEDGKFVLEGATFKIAPSKAKIDSTVSYDTDGDGFEGTRIGLKASIPAQEVTGGAQAVLDEFTSTWAIGPSLAMEWVSGRADDPRSTEYVLAVSPQWSFQKFKFAPNLSDDVEQTRHSIIAEVRAQLHCIGDAMELKLRYEREWLASKEVGVVTVAPTSDPALVEKSVVRDAPTVAPSFTARVFFWHRFGNGPIALGPSLAAIAKAEKGTSWSPAGSVVIGRSEVWTFFTPKDAKPANFRIGVAPFVDLYGKGQSDKGSELDIGVLFQARLGSDIFSY